MKVFYPLCLLALAAGWFQACQPTPSQVEATPPNVLLILTDDQGYGDVHIHGNDSIETPTQDMLAREGIRLDNFFVSPVCAPTRASLLSGRYHYRTGTTWVTRNAETMRGNETTLAEVFKGNGYATGCFGKWHNGSHYPEHPLGQGFDEFTGFCAGHWNNYFDPMLESQGTSYRAEGYIIDILTDSAMSFMERNAGQPFFCYVPYNTPHTPYIVGESYFDKYKRKGLTDRVASTYGMVENIDDNIGRMLTMLEDRGLLENTLVIFLTDNGPNYDRYNGGMKGRKGWVNDGGVRVPCFFYWKGKWAGGRTLEEITSHIDILPTLVDLLQLSPLPTQPLDGISFAPLLTGENDTLASRDLFTFSINKNRFKGSVRNRTHRLVVNGENDYVLTRFPDDRGEEHDLTADFPELAQNLYRRYLDAYDEVTEGLVEFPPISMGYEAAPEVELPAHEGFFTGGMAYKASQWGWANDWFTQWQTPVDTMYWHVNNQSAGTYRVSLKYTAPPSSIGTRIEVHGPVGSISTVLEEAFIPEIFPNQDIVPREVEADDQTWGTLFIGELQIPAGEQRISLSATQIKGEEVGEVKALILEKAD